MALAWSLHPLVHDDLFWHLRTGEWIAAHHRVPLADLFSYTRQGARWIVVQLPGVTDSVSGSADLCARALTDTKL